MTQDPTRLFRLDGRIAFITGASSGIGAALAQGFAAAGAAVALVARRIERIEQLAATIQAAGGRAVAVQLDVTDRATMPRAFDHAASSGPEVPPIVTSHTIASNVDASSSSFARPVEVAVVTS